ncbi:MAG: hypothetical protein AABX17_02260 [Nanoarchaeota archaeon]
MEMHRRQYLELKNENISALIGLMKEQALRMDYHFKLNDEEFWRALEESIDLSTFIEGKSEFERIEYFRTTEQLRDSVQEIECYEDLTEFNAHLSYFRHCFLKGIPREKL